ncbi:MAG: triose-phosphate isomerase [Deltaproteobacteria bacterium]|nr:triose-phosphate isomerase [Deltaproteobacteria bacterium]
MTQRKPLIAGNWKMNKTCAEAMDTARTLVSLVSDVKDVEVMITPPFTALAQVADIIASTPVELGAQDVFWEDHGAYTGQVSAPMLVSAGCTYVIIGHSERRQYFNETDQTVNKKVKAAFAGGLAPVVCVGETEADRDAQKTFSVLDKQMDNGLEGLTVEIMANAVIAYEPVWAIGTGKTATPLQVQEVHAFLRSFLKQRFGDGIAGQIRILYGGSVKPGNAAELMALADVDGALVGGASLDAEIFSKIVHFGKA